jgi:hypothetical protein
MVRPMSCPVGTGGYTPTDYAVSALLAAKTSMGQFGKLPWADFSKACTKTLLVALFLPSL